MTAPLGTGTLIWLLVDGLPAELARGFAARRPASHLACCLRGEPARQARALLPLQPNCQTPPSLFTIWSGLRSERHGMTGYDVPRTGTPLAVAEGFSHWPREPLMAWDRLASSGCRLRLCAMPFVQPHRLGNALLAHTSIYGRTLVEPALLRHGQRWDLPAAGMVLQVHAHLGGIELQASDAGTAPLAVPLHSTHHVDLGSGGSVTVACVSVDGQPLLAVFGLRDASITDATGTRPHSRPTALACNPGLFYQRGQLGMRLCDGGKGEAEAALIELMQVVHQSFADDIRTQLHAGDASVLMAYYPIVDLLCHQLLRYLHPDTATPQQRAVCEPLIDQALGWVDELVGLCLQAWPHAQMIAHSDHGMLPVLHDVHANVAFERLGWLTFVADGQVDIAHTAAFMHPADNGLVVFDCAALQARGATPQQVLGELRDLLPTSLQRGWYAIEGPAIDLGSRWHACQYLQAPPNARWRTCRSSQVVLPSQKGGDHTVACSESWLQGVLFAMGQGFPTLPNTALTLEALLPLVLGALQPKEMQEDAHG